MHEGARQAARQAAESLLAALRAHDDQATVAPAIEQCEQLLRAIDAFHMEAIRFRTYTIARMLGAGPPGAAGFRPLLDRLRAALDAAGFPSR
jgi:hypothetical protein